jgi:hypothetical protein
VLGVDEVPGLAALVQRRKEGEAAVVGAGQPARQAKDALAHRAQTAQVQSRTASQVDADQDVVEEAHRLISEMGRGG